MSVFVDEFAGEDLGSKINAAIASLPYGGIVDATRIWPTNTPENIKNTVIVDRPIKLLLGVINIESLANPSTIIQWWSFPCYCYQRDELHLRT